MAGKIVVVRTSSFAGVLQGWQIALDGKGLFGINSGEYSEFLLSEGEHSITLRCSQAFMDCCLPSVQHYEDTLDFFIEASQTIYFLASPSLKCGKIRLSDETEAKKHIEGSKFINLQK